MDSLAMNHVHSALCNYGLGASFGTPRTAGTTANRTYTPSSVHFGKTLEEQSHSHQMDRLWTDNHYSMNSAPKVAFGASGAGWVPFGANAKSANRLNVLA